MILAVVLASFLADVDWQGVVEVITTVALVGGGGHRAYLRILDRLDRLERRWSALRTLPRRLRVVERRVGVEPEDSTANGRLPDEAAE